MVIILNLLNLLNLLDYLLLGSLLDEIAFSISFFDGWWISLLVLKAWKKVCFFPTDKKLRVLNFGL